MNFNQMDTTNEVQFTSDIVVSVEAELLNQGAILSSRQIFAIIKIFSHIIFQLIKMIEKQK